MLPLRIVIAGVCAGIVANVTGYLITGRLFHRYQALTPGTWRRGESWHQYLGSSAIRLAACVGIAALYYGCGERLAAHALGPLAAAAAFGAALWAVTALPLVAESALFVNWHPGFVAGLLLDWLVVAVVACAAVGLTQGPA